MGDILIVLKFCGVEEKRVEVETSLAKPLYSITTTRNVHMMRQTQRDNS